jgi:phasin family protein
MNGKTAKKAGDAAETAFTSATLGYEKLAEQTRSKMGEAAKAFDEFAVLGKDTAEAVRAASTAYAKGLEQLTAEWLSFSKQSVEEGIATTKALMGARTIQEVMDLQTTFAKAQFDQFVNRGAKFGEMATKVAQETFEPLNQRATVAVEKFIKLAA